MAALLIGNIKITTCASPFRAMRCDAATARARLREQMREFVAKRAIDFVRADLAQSRIQRDERVTKNGATRCAAHARIPFHQDFFREFSFAKIFEKSTRIYLQGGIAADEG